MSATAKLGTINNAYDDLLRRTLSGIPCDLARLIYLASTRDYNSGIYHHEGLSARHNTEMARDALQAAHRDIFFRLIALSLEERRAWDFNSITIDPQNSDALYIPDVALYRSEDGGKTISIVRGAPGGDDYHQIWVDPENSSAWFSEPIRAQQSASIAARPGAPGTTSLQHSSTM